MYRHPDSKAADEANEYLKNALTLGEQMLRSGSEASRVEDSIRRICLAYGAERVDVLTITASIVVTISGERFGVVTQTRRVTRIRFDLQRLELLNQLSRRMVEEKLSGQQVERELERIDRAPSYTFLQQIFIYMLVSSSFAIFFGGDGWDALASALIGVVLKFADAGVKWLEVNGFVGTLLCSVLGGLLAYLLVDWGLGSSVEMISIGNIMLLIPGVMLTNSIRELFSGDTISGLLRFMEALLLTVMIALGFVAASLIGG